MNIKERRQKLEAALRKLRGRRAAELDAQAAEFIERYGSHGPTPKEQPKDEPKKNEPQLAITARGVRKPFDQWVYERLLNFAQQALCEDDPYLRVAGHERLRAVSQVISKDAAKMLARGPRNRANASAPRKKRGPSPKTKLVRRGLGCVLDQLPDLTAESLCDLLDAEGSITYDDRDIEVRNAGENILIRDLRTRAKLASATIKKTSLRQYLKDAKDH